MPPPLVIAHRGYSAVAPENTLASFEAALRIGADLLELDVRRSADGVAVVVHDPTVDRTTDGTGAVAGLDAHRLTGMDAGGRFPAGWTDARIPRLADVADLVRAHPAAGLLVEFKGSWTAAQIVGATAALRPAGIAARCLVQSFDRDVLTGLRAELPDVRRALLVVRPSRSLLRSREAARTQAERARVQFGVVAVNPRIGRGLPAAAVAGYHDAGVRTFPWTVDDPRQWAELHTAGVDGIITDSPGRLRGFLGALAAAGSARDEVLQGLA